MNFDLDSKIRQNKARLRHDYENLRNIQNSYGYVVIYLSFIGLTFFDFIDHIKSITELDWLIIVFLLSLSASLVLIAFTIIQFVRLFMPRDVAHDLLPEFVYRDMYEKVSAWAIRNNKKPEEETKKSYLEVLEQAVEINFNLYILKRELLFKTIKYALISLVPYFISMILFNLIKS